MPSSTLEEIILRNSDFLSVRRAGSGDGQAGIYNAITGGYVMGLGGGWIPEYSRATDLKYDCDCTPGGYCRTGQHGTRLIRGWRNILFEMLAQKRLRDTREIRRLIGDDETLLAREHGLSRAPMYDPHQVNSYASL